MRGAVDSGAGCGAATALDSGPAAVSVVPGADAVSCWGAGTSLTWPLVLVCSGTGSDDDGAAAAVVGFDAEPRVPAAFPCGCGSLGVVSLEVMINAIAGFQGLFVGQSFPGASGLTYQRFIDRSKPLFLQDAKETSSRGMIRSTM